MEQSFVGIDVAKDRLDVHVRPSGDTFALARDGEGVAVLVERLRAADQQDSRSSSLLERSMSQNPPFLYGGEP
jgi:hypothetical protein